MDEGIEEGYENRPFRIWDLSEEGLRMNME
jgi:hypothetical protein